MNHTSSPHESGPPTQVGSEDGRRLSVLRDTSRHLVVGSALAFVGSVLAGTVVGLPAALAQSGLGIETAPQTRFAGTIDAADVRLGVDLVVAQDLPVSVNGVTDGGPVRVMPTLPAGVVTTGANVPVAATNGATGTPDPAAAGSLGIPAPVLDAYKKAADIKNKQMPSCHIDWSLIAAVGKVESDHAAGGKVDADGRTRGNIEGPSTPYGTAKGPMQFLDSSWAIFGADGNGDGVKDPHNIYDASLAAANHLCGSGGGNLQNPENLRKGIYGYNRADWYVKKIIDWMNQYSGRAIAVPPATGDIPTRPNLPAVTVPAPGTTTTTNPAPGQTTTPNPPVTGGAPTPSTPPTTEQTSSPSVPGSGGLTQSPASEPTGTAASTQAEETP